MGIRIKKMVDCESKYVIDNTARPHIAHWQQKEAFSKNLLLPGIANSARFDIKKDNALFCAQVRTTELHQVEHSQAINPIPSSAIEKA